MGRIRNFRRRCFSHYFRPDYWLWRDNLYDDTDSALSNCEDRLIANYDDFTKASAGKIKNSIIFTGLNSQQIMELAPYIHRTRFNTDQTVFKQGEEGSKAYYLLKGRMDVLIDIPASSRKRRISSMTEGTLFGEMGLLDGSPRSAIIVAVCDSISLSFTKVALRATIVLYIIFRN